MLSQKEGLNSGGCYDNAAKESFFHILNMQRPPFNVAVANGRLWQRKMRFA
jgi:hypothetical protein